MFRAIFSFLFSQIFFIFNDNLMKNSLVAFAIFSSANKTDDISSISGGLFILPFILFSSFSGFLSDKFPKKTLLLSLKLLEFILIILCFLSIYYSSYILMYVSIFCLGIQSTLYSPIRISLVPELVSNLQGNKENILRKANGIIEGTGFVALLLGTLLGNYLVNYSSALLYFIIISFVVSFLGMLFLFLIPKQKDISVHNDTLSINIIKDNIYLFKLIGEEFVWKEVLGITSFWFLSSYILMVFPVLVHDILHRNVILFTYFLATFSIGMGLGSIFCKKIMDYISQRILLLVYMISVILLSIVSIFLNIPLIYIGLFFTSFLGGCYSVSLYSSIQSKVEEHKLGKIIAGNNIVNSLSMVLASILMITSASLSINYMYTLIVMTLVCMFVLKKKKGG